MSTDDDTINLREKDLDQTEFKIDHIENNDRVRASYLDENDIKKATDQVKVKFDKFVNLVATHAYEDVVDKYMDEDVIISTDLLTDLASSQEEKEDKKTPVIFIIGIVLGVLVTWFILKS